MVVPRKDLSDNKGERFKTLALTINATAYKQYGWRSSDSKPFTVGMDRPSRFIGTLHDTHDPTTSLSHKTIPYQIESTANPIFAFASAPKLPKDCHRLPGLLAGKTKEIPDELRNKYFELRQQLLGLLLIHEGAKLSVSITSEVLPKHCTSDRTSSHVKNLSRLHSSLTVPVAQTMINNCLTRAKKLRHEIRTKAIRDIKNPAIRITLTDGGFFSLKLFSDDSVRIAEEFLKVAPPPVYVNVTATPTSSSGRTSSRPYERGSYRGAYATPRGSRGHGNPAPHSSSFRPQQRGRGTHSYGGNNTRGFRGRGHHAQHRGSSNYARGSRGTTSKGRSSSGPSRH